MKIEQVYFSNKENILNLEFIENIILKELKSIIENVNANSCFTKKSKEMGKEEKYLFAPKQLNSLFKEQFRKLNWERARLNAPFNKTNLVIGNVVKKTVEKKLKLTDFLIFVNGNINEDATVENFRNSLLEYVENEYYESYDSYMCVPHSYEEVDFFKEFLINNLEKIKVSLEIQFGKYSFMSRDNLIKAPLFHQAGVSDISISICPIRDMTKKMSSGVGYFEKSLQELNYRKTSHPLILIGISP